MITVFIMMITLLSFEQFYFFIRGRTVVIKWFRCDNNFNGVNNSGNRFSALTSGTVI